MRPPPPLPPRPGPGHPLFHYVVQGPHAIALYDYQGSAEDELSFKVQPARCLTVLLYPPLNEIEGGYTGFNLSVCPSILLSICPPVRLWTEVCPLCIFYNTHQIYFIFRHLIKQLHKVCCVKRFFSKLKILKFGKFFKFVALTLSCFDLGSNMSWSIVWVIMGRWGWGVYHQNAGILVGLVDCDVLPSAGH